MHSAPAVSYPVGRFSWALGFTLVILFLNLTVLLFWWLKADGLWWAALMGGGLALGVGLSALQHWWDQSAAELHWDGRAWQLHDPRGSSSGRVTVRLDGQHHLLAEFRPETGTPRWLGLSRASDPARWGLLRCALVASALGALPPAAGQGLAREPAP